MTRYFLFYIILFCSLISFAQKNEITIISWNIKHFGQTKNSNELEKIADIVKDADIIAIQEVVAGYGGTQAVAKLTDILNRKGAQWDYIVSDPTQSSKYMLERYAYVWKNKHIKIKNRGRLVSELQRLIEREPLAVDFFINGKRLSLFNYHSIPHQKNPRLEIEALTNYIMAEIETPILLAGDFNLSDTDAVFNKFIDNGYSASVTNTKTTIKRKCDNGNYLNYNIDNIYFSSGILKLKAGVIDFVFVCDQIETARKLSDHLPVFLKFRLK